MKYRIIGFLCIIVGICLLASQFINNKDTRVYVYPPGAQEEAYPVKIQSSDSQLIVDGCSIPHKTVTIEVSEAEAKKMREEAGYSSEGVSGGIIVVFQDIGSCF